MQLTMPCSLATDSRAEKPARATLFSAVVRALNKETIVIVDAMNYIKGSRYQMYCAAREASVRPCTVSRSFRGAERKLTISYRRAGLHRYPASKMRRVEHYTTIDFLLHRAHVSLELLEHQLTLANVGPPSAVWRTSSHASKSPHHQHDGIHHSSPSPPSMAV